MHRRFWLETAGEEILPRPPLARSTEVDVAILGGGYTGLWTAYSLLRAMPGLTVAIAEKEIVGFGASGRNGGWCSSKFPVSPGALEHRYGRQAARDLMLEMNASVDEIERFCQEEAVDAHFYKGGMLTLARAPHHLPAIADAHAQLASLGLGHQARLLGAAEASERVRATKVLGALYDAENASIHPGRLVRGLARAVERRGGLIYEQTEVTGFAGGAKPRLMTPAGEIRARQAIVLAGEAYLSRLPGLHRCVLPLYSLISLTEPLTAEQWSRLGWQQRESLSSARLTVDYLTRTADGRILFGSRGAPYRFASRISDAQDCHAATHAHIRRMLIDWFPSLEGIHVTHEWGGAVGMPRDWMPMASFDPATRIATARGYTGQGVSTTNLAGRILAALILGRQDPIAALPMAQRQSRFWEPEPLRWLGVRYAQNAFLRIDEALESGRRAPLDAPLAQRFASH